MTRLVACLLAAADARAVAKLCAASGSGVCVMLSGVGVWGWQGMPA